MENGAVTERECRLGVYRTDEGCRYLVSICLSEEDGELSYVTRVRVRSPGKKRREKKKEK